MQEIGKLNVDNMQIKNRVETYPQYPNVITMHPTMTDNNNKSFNGHDENIICLIDLAQQNFQVSDITLLNSYWWLSFKSYYNQCQIIFSQYLLTLEKDNNDKNKIISNIICQYAFIDLSEEMSLTSDHHIADLFSDTHFDTDTMIALNAPKPKQKFDFLTFSDDNPYANIDKLKIDDDKTKTDSKIEDKEQEQDMQHKIEFIRADINKTKLFKWYEILIPDIKSPKTTSRETSESVYNEMLKYWECKLSQDKRFLIVFPEKLGEICDVFLTKQGKIYWIQSLNADKKENCHALNNDNFNLRRIFAFNECDVMKQFKTKVNKLLVSVEEPARYKIMGMNSNNDNDSMLIWNFSINGAVNDCFSVINPTNPKLNDRLLQIDNAQNFSNYRFKDKDGELKDLIRDVPKLCNLDGSIVFGGACFLSILSSDKINKIHVYDDTENDGPPTLMTNKVSSAFSYSSWIPIKICNVKDNSKWITDYIIFKNKCILGRWQGNIGKSVYGIWDNNGDCIESNEYDGFKWNNSTMCCYHFGDRIKTILLSLQLQQQNA